MWSLGTRNSSFKGLHLKIAEFSILFYFFFFIHCQATSWLNPWFLCPLWEMQTDSNDFNYSMRKENKASTLHIDLNTSILCCSFRRGSWKKNHSDIMIHVECHFILFLVRKEKKKYSAIFLYLYRKEMFLWHFRNHFGLQVRNFCKMCCNVSPRPNASTDFSTVRFL